MTIVQSNESNIKVSKAMAIEEAKIIVVGGGIGGVAGDGLG